MSIPINMSQLEAALSEVRKDPILSRIFSNWANLILHWEARHLHGLTDVSAIELAVGLSMYEVETANGGLMSSIWVDITRPITFAYMVGDKMIHKEIVVKPPLTIEQ